MNLQNTYKRIKKTVAKQFIASGKYKTEESARNAAQNEACKVMNERYGYGWRTLNKKAITFSDSEREPRTYEEWWQQCNLDGSFAYNGVTDDF